MNRLNRYALILEGDKGQMATLRYADKSEAVNAWQIINTKYDDMLAKLIDLWECYEYVGDNTWCEETKSNECNQVYN